MVDITEPSVAKAARVSLSAAFANSWVTSVEGAKVAKLLNITEIAVNIAGFRSAWRWA